MDHPKADLKSRGTETQHEDEDDASDIPMHCAGGCNCIPNMKSLHQMAALRRAARERTKAEALRIHEAATSNLEIYLSRLKSGWVPETDGMQVFQCEIFGRVERCVINEGRREVPEMISFRPHRRQGMDPPASSFVLSSEAMISLIKAKSIREVLSNVVSLCSRTVDERILEIRENKLDHVLIVFSSTEVSTELADLNGLIKIVQSVHTAAAERFANVADRFRSLIGNSLDQFILRRNLLSDEEWERLRVIKGCLYLGTHDLYPRCGCSIYSFDTYCSAFDSAASHSDLRKDEKVLETRRMMFMLLGCNDKYGFDGFSYGDDGQQLDREYITLNGTILGESKYHTFLLSDVERFRDLK
jgi:hypothetical protein